MWGAYSAYYSSEEYIYRTCTRTFATVPPRAESKPPPAVQQVNDVGLGHDFYFSFDHAIFFSRLSLRQMTVP